MGEGGGGGFAAPWIMQCMLEWLRVGAYIFGLPKLSHAWSSADRIHSITLLQGFPAQQYFLTAQDNLVDL